jgi:hypothetical protein
MSTRAKKGAKKAAKEGASETPSHLAERKTAQQLHHMAKAAGIPQSKNGDKFTKMQLARRLVAAKK